MEGNGQTKQLIEEGGAILGIEMGSTRIKGVLINENNEPIAQGSHEWENRLENGIWTYSMEDVRAGIADCYRDLAADVEKQYGVKITGLKAIGISAMMHGYLPFDENGKQLAPFRTWRNTITEEASSRLTELFQYHIPQRWSIAHLYQAILNGEEHVKDIRFITTLSGYVHWLLTGEKVLGVGDASGMFPIDPSAADYNAAMETKFDALIADRHYPWKLKEILPKSLKAGEAAGTLTAAGAELLDPSGLLQAGIPLCPPEGDAGTGMAAANSVAKRTGNVSAGTSVFSMVVLEKPLSKYYEELDLVTTPSGDEVAMVHCNNCTSDLNAWVNLFDEFCKAMGMEADKGKLFSVLYHKAMEGDADCGGLLAYNFFSGEPIARADEGRPLFVRTPESRFTLANFMRVHLFTALGALKIGNDILMKQEKVAVDRLMAHGGLFKTKGVGQNILAAAMDAPVTCMETAGEGGAWGIALLASFLVNGSGKSLENWLNDAVFGSEAGETVNPDPEDVKGFDAFTERYQKGLAIENAAIASLH